MYWMIDFVTIWWRLMCRCANVQVCKCADVQMGWRFGGIDLTVVKSRWGIRRLNRRVRWGRCAEFAERACGCSDGFQTHRYGRSQVLCWRLRVRIERRLSRTEPPLFCRLLAETALLTVGHYVSFSKSLTISFNDLPSQRRISLRMLA